MNTRILRRIISFILSALLLAGVIVFSGIVAAAQRPVRRVVIVRPIRPIDPFGWRWRRFDRYNYYSQYVFRNGEEAYADGHKAGLKTGRSDGKKHKSFDPERSHHFHDAGFGNFAEAHRQGFSRGYDEGYRAAAVG